jgi:hypothetical protein
VTRRPDSTPSPQARRQARQGALLEALARRDAPTVERLLGQWVHRQGHPSLQALLQELAQAAPEAMAWWQGLPAAVTPARETPAAQEFPEEPAEERAPALPASSPQPHQPNPELAKLRSWLPDRVERRRAA